MEINIIFFENECLNQLSTHIDANSQQYCSLYSILFRNKSCFSIFFIVNETFFVSSRANFVSSRGNLRNVSPKNKDASSRGNRLEASKVVKRKS